MKEHEKLFLAGVGAVGIYLFFSNKDFRKAVLKACHESAKRLDAAENSERAITNTASTAAKQKRRSTGGCET